jgi:hypothetical protein
MHDEMQVIGRAASERVRFTWLDDEYIARGELNRLRLDADERRPARDEVDLSDASVSVRLVDALVREAHRHL